MAVKTNPLAEPRGPKQPPYWLDKRRPKVERRQLELMRDLECATKITEEQYHARKGQKNEGNTGTDGEDS